MRQAPFDAIPWRCAIIRTIWTGDIDEYRAKYGKLEGEARFFADQALTGRVAVGGNLLMVGGASNLFEYAMGNGTGTAGQPLTYLNGANTSLGVGDSTAAELATQTDLQATTNKVRQVVDGTYPAHTPGNTAKAITGASNATPIVITSPSHGLANGTFVHIQGVGGNAAANGLWLIQNVAASTFELAGSVGSGAYTSGGLAATSNVLTVQATFGTGQANYAWQEVAMFNATTAGAMINRKVAALGTKTSTGSWALKLGLAIG